VGLADGAYVVLRSKLEPGLILHAAAIAGDVIATALVGALAGALFRGRAAWIAGGIAGLLVRATVIAFGDAAAVSVDDPPAVAARASGPNVVLITLDTTRADRGDPTGAHQVSTPTLDAIARDGARFERAYSQIPVTGPSHTTILTGHGPWEHGNLLNGLVLPSAFPLLSEVLRSEGYATAAFVSGFVLEGELGFARGFDVYDDDFDGTGAWRDTAPGALLAMARRRFQPDHVLERRGDRTVEAALAWLERPRDRPFFLWVHLFDPHGPYTPPPPWDEQYYEGDPRDPGHHSMEQATGMAPYLRASVEGITDAAWVQAQYEGEISFADQQAGRIIDAIRSEDAVVVFTADHGESLGEHGVWFNHGDDVYGESTRVPLAIRWPTRIAAGTIMSSPVELTDVAATILDLVGVSSRLGGSSLFASERSYARSICFDRAANRRAREAGAIDRPTFRMVALAGVDGTFVHRDAPGSTDEWSGTGEPPLAEAQALLGPVASTDRDPSMLERLEALGYTE
jgi:arylsulfatase A-like enzyme